MVTLNTQEDKTTITLLPNRSATMRQTRLLIYAVSGFVMIVGIAWSLMGAYLILPFAGLEVGLFAYFMIKICRATYEKQVITIEKDRVTIHSGMHSIEQTNTLQRPDAHLVVVEPERPTNPLELNLTDSTLRLEIGSFLNHQERLTTRLALKEAGLPEHKHQWWLNS